MATSVFANGAEKAYGIKHFIVDTPSDIDKLSKSYTPGCTAFVIEDSTYYMLNHHRQWIKVNIVGGSGGGGDEPEPKDYIYDGGLET